MEPAEAPLRLAFITKVKEVDEKHIISWVGGIGKDAQFARYSLGWYILYEGSWEHIYAGTERPPFEVGDTVKITMEKHNAKSG